MAGVTEEIMSNVDSIVDRDMKNIFNAQLLIARKNVRFQGKKLAKKYDKRDWTIESRYPRLYAQLQSHPYRIVSGPTGCYVSMDVMKQLRFLDMKKYGNMQIYNRQVWGIIYHNTFRDIRSGVSATLYNTLTAKLKGALDSDYIE